MEERGYHERRDPVSLRFLPRGRKQSPGGGRDRRARFPEDDGAGRRRRGCARGEASARRDRVPRPAVPREGGPGDLAVREGPSGEMHPPPRPRDRRLGAGDEGGAGGGRRRVRSPRHGALRGGQRRSRRLLPPPREATDEEDRRGGDQQIGRDGGDERPARPRDRRVEESRREAMEGAADPRHGSLEGGLPPGGGSGGG